MHPSALRSRVFVQGGHNQVRSRMLDMCEYNDSFWSYEVVLSPGTALSTYAHAHYDDQHSRVKESSRFM